MEFFLKNGSEEPRGRTGINTQTENGLEDMGRVGGREMQEGREMGTYCICITDSLCYKAEANTLL